ncbi:MAG: MotA/TolQ/ExbB proton channel family protein [Candidatus Latescibacteria bacterium]|jgi:biopolymer transport protein ExbB/TolQ|nr:MotA/TolQ/ExbB proton channel family protein [Candidatus Latescibacterota bacterium]
MGELNLLEMLSAVVFAALCAMSGSLILMQRMAAICTFEGRQGLSPGNTALIGAAVGGLAGLAIGAVYIYYYLLVPGSGGWILWVGRSSYALVLAASAGHLAVLIHIWMRLDAEESDLKSQGRGPQKATLSLRRRTALDEALRTHPSYADLRARDDEAVETLVAVFGERLLMGQRALNRVPFYGYLGTVCGILLMAQELTHLDEATETFRVLRDMAGGLVLAFQTTLVALLAYLPLRKAFDLLLTRVADLERSWLALREEEDLGS